MSELTIKHAIRHFGKTYRNDLEQYIRALESWMELYFPDHEIQVVTTGPANQELRFNVTGPKVHFSVTEFDIARNQDLDFLEIMDGLQEIKKAIEESLRDAVLDASDETDEWAEMYDDLDDDEDGEAWKRR
jgi:hypothetical protein